MVFSSCRCPVLFYRNQSPITPMSQTFDEQQTFVAEWNSLSSHWWGCSWCPWFLKVRPWQLIFVWQRGRQTSWFQLNWWPWWQLAQLRSLGLSTFCPSCWTRRSYCCWRCELRLGSRKRFRCDETGSHRGTCRSHPFRKQAVELCSPEIE